MERRPYQYLYDDGEAFNFMHEETYEQITLPHDVVENADLMKEGQRVEMMFLTDPEERCLTCELPTYVTLEVTYSEPAVKGQDHGPPLHRDRRSHHREHHRPFLRPTREIRFSLPDNEADPRGPAFFVGVIPG